ncbi:MAG: hypothetical protein DMD91_11110 [Candidatus Rokuibacteriota bacterium]|nr:MAG: hypothetical protein DMD91_11110 [Candidatus Rokubacteria bacterium]
MLSRVADSLYWMGRYLERAENITRLLLVTEDFSTETQGFAEDLAQGVWKDLLAIFPAAQMTKATSPFAPLAVPYLHGFFLDAGNPYSIHFSVRKARENARSVREALTLEVFLAINEAYHALERYENRGLVDLPAFRAALTATQKGLFTILGAIDNTFPRDETWRFVKLGEAVERLYRSAIVLRVKLPALLAAEPRTDLPLYYTQWRTLLRALSSLENYRRVYGARLEPPLVIAFLLFDANAPRSLRYGAAALKECLEAIAGPGALTPPARLVGRLHADLYYDQPDLTGRADYAGLLDRVSNELSQVHDALDVLYFMT